MPVPKNIQKMIDDLPEKARSAVNLRYRPSDDAPWEVFRAIKELSNLRERKASFDVLRAWDLTYRYGVKGPVGGAAEREAMALEKAIIRAAAQASVFEVWGLFSRQPNLEKKSYEEQKSCVLNKR